MSLDNVKATVLGDAKARAGKMLDEARAKVESALAESRSADERRTAEIIRDTKLRLERETVRELERIQHDNRLEILAAKNRAIDEVFRRVGEKLKAMPDGDYVKLVGAWLHNLPADGGGVLRVNPADAAKFEAGLETINQGRKAAGKFTGVTADPKVPNGAVVDGPDYTIDCTIDRRLDEMRETSAGDLARVLFGA